MLKLNLKEFHQLEGLMTKQSWKRMNLLWTLKKAKDEFWFMSPIQKE